jgi:glucose-6-phosphate 1-epimerase
MRLLTVGVNVLLITSMSQSREGAIFQEGRDVVTISEWTDRIYQNTPQEHIITNVVSGRKMRIQKYNFPDTGK